MEKQGLLSKWLGLLSRDGSAVQSCGNRVELFFEGDDAFREMRDAIEAAEIYVHQEMYMFLSDEVGWRCASFGRSLLGENEVGFWGAITAKISSSMTVSLLPEE